MKKTAIFFLAAIIVVSFAACSLEPPAMGHLTIDVPLVSQARSALSGEARSLEFVSSDAPKMRLYINHNSAFIPSSKTGTDYFEASLVAASTGASDSNSITLDLPAGSGYRVYVVLGTTITGWQPKYYGGTDDFTVSAGVYTKKTIVVADKAFETLTGSAGPASVAVVNGKLWAYIGTKVKNLSDSTEIAFTKKVSSLSAGSWFKGAPELWINTESDGIWAVLADNTLVQRSKTFGSGAKVSGAIGYTINESSGLGVYYYGAGKNAGAAGTTSSSSAGMFDTWDIDSDQGFKMDLPSLLSDSSKVDEGIVNLLNKISNDLILGTAFVLRGTNYVDSYGFVSTALGSFYYTKAVYDQIKDEKDIGAWIQGNVTNLPFALSAISAAGKSLPITSLALDGLANGTLYAGTAAGLYTVALADGTPINAKNAASGKLQAVQLDRNAGIGSVSIKALAATNFGGSSYAAYADANGTLALLKDGAALKDADSLAVSYPFYAFTATQTGVRSMTFYTESGALKLAVACTDGVATFIVAAN